MQINYIQKTDILTEELINNYKKNNDINFNIYGRYKNLLFILNNNKIDVFDTAQKKFITTIDADEIHYVSDTHGHYSFFQYQQDENGNIGDVCIFDEHFNIEDISRKEVRKRFNLKINLNHNFLNNGDECYNLNYEDIEYSYSSAWRTNKFIELLVNKKNDIVLALSSTHLKENIPKINENYIDMQKERISNDKWDGMSKYKYKLAIITKNGLYGVINDNYEIVFDYNPDIINIKILSYDTILIENKNHEKFLYNINTKTMQKYKENISLNNIQMLKDNIYRLQKGNKYKLYIDHKLYEGLYDDIYTETELDIIILENNKKTKIIDTKGNILLQLNSNKFFVIQNDIYYKLKDGIYKFNLKSMQSDKINNYFIKTEDGQEIPYDDKSIFLTYKYYYNDSKTHDMVLCKDMKYGLEIKDNDISVVRWFNSREKMIEVHRLILENMFSSICDNQELPKTKNLKL